MWLLFVLVFIAGFAVLVAGVLAAAVVVGAIVDEWEALNAASDIATTTTTTDRTTTATEPGVCVPETLMADGWVTDTVGLVTDDAVLERVAEEADYRHEIAVVLIADSGACSPNDFAAEVGDTWGLGDPERNDWFVVLVDDGEGRTVIETGSGVRVSSEILNWVAAMANDHFAAGDFDGGILAIMGGLASVQAEISIRPQLEADRTVLLSDRSGIDRLSLVGTARDLDGAVSLTRKTGGLHQAGAVWFPEEVMVGDGFESQFVFEIDHVSWYSIGDGFAFVIQDNGPKALGEVASGNGYEGIPSSVAVEFDTVYHDYKADPWFPVPGDEPPGVLANHVAVHSQGIEPNSANGRAMIESVGLQDVLLYDRSHHMALVRYTPGTLSVFVDDLDAPVLTVQFDLSDALNLADGAAYIGFTAATEPGSYTDFLVHGWAFDSCDEGVSQGERCPPN
jgi:hypothetical protein